MNALKLRIFSAKEEHFSFFILGKRRALFNFVMGQFDLCHWIFKIIVFYGKRKNRVEELLQFLCSPIFSLFNDPEQIVLNIDPGVCHRMWEEVPT